MFTGNSESHHVVFDHLYTVRFVLLDHHMIVIVGYQPVQQLLHLLDIDAVSLQQVHAIDILVNTTALPTLPIDLMILMHLSHNHRIGLLDHMREGKGRLWLV